METDNINKPRTIKMKYPAPYSQSWTDNQDTGVNKRKSKVFNPSQSHVPPHTQSWPNDRNAKRLKRKPSPRGSVVKKVVRPKKVAVQRPSQKVNSADPFSGGPWRPVKQRMARGPDPTAPHLKYGLFPKKNVNKSAIQVMSASAPEPKSRTSTAEHSSKKDKKIKGKKGQKEGETPMFVFRAIDPRYTRQLSVSAPTHIDIRPRAKPGLFGTPAPPYNTGRVASQIKTVPQTVNNTAHKKSVQVLPKRNTA